MTSQTMKIDNRPPMEPDGDNPDRLQHVWKLTRGAPLGQLEQAMHAFGVAAPVAQALWARGITPELLSPPEVIVPLHGLHEAAAQLAEAIRSGARILVHGDYDADGVTSSAIMVRAVRELGGNIQAYIPAREGGYGLQMDKVPELAEQADLLITVDCGVTALAEVRELQRLGCEVIVTDHHEPLRMPEAGEPGHSRHGALQLPGCTVVHPQLRDETYDPLRHGMTGAGVAYHLAWALRLAMPSELGGDEPEPKHLRGIAAIGTIADVAPLLGENRALCRGGLEDLASSPLAGVRALAGEVKGVTARDVSFSLAPRLNAAGRMGDAALAYRLLCSDDPKEAAALKKEIDALNEARKALQQQMFEEACAMVEAEMMGDAVLLVHAPHWSGGVMGIVASKLVEAYARPVFIAAGFGLLRGSARSFGGFDLVGALDRCAKHLRTWGGHVGAAGFSLDQAELGALREALQAAHTEVSSQDGPPAVVTLVDGPIGGPGEYGADHLALSGELRNLEPLGQGIEAPRWHVAGEAGGTRLVGKSGTTLQVQLQGLKGVMHGYDPARGLPQGQWQAAASISENEWRGETSAEWQCDALRPAAPLELELGEMSERDLAKVKAAQRLIARTEPRAAMELLAAGSHSWHATGEQQAWLEGKGYPRASEGAAPEGQPRDIICFAVPQPEQLSGWLKAGRPVTFSLGERTMQLLEMSYTEPYDADRADDQALAYHLLRWAHSYRWLSDAAFAADVLSLSGMLEAPASQDGH